MAWVTPRTWVDGNLVSYTGTYSLNTELRDNLNALKTPAFGTDVTTNVSTSSVPYVQISGLSVTLTTYGSKVVILLVGSAANTIAANDCYFDFAIDGVRYGLDYTFKTTGADLITPFAFWYITASAPSAGSHTYDVYWHGVGNLLYASANMLRLFVKELS